MGCKHRSLWLQGQCLLPLQFCGGRCVGSKWPWKGLSMNRSEVVLAEKWGLWRWARSYENSCVSSTQAPVKDRGRGRALEAACVFPQNIRDFPLSFPEGSTAPAILCFCRVKDSGAGSSSMWRLEAAGSLSEVGYLFLFFWTTMRGMWDLSSPTRDWVHAPCSDKMDS